MKLSDIRGERALDIMADAMELAELIGGDERFEAMRDDLKSHDGDRDEAWRVLCRHLPAIIRDERYKERIISVLAAASGVTVEEYSENGEILLDLFELFTTDYEALGFLAGSAVRTA